MIRGTKLTNNKNISLRNKFIEIKDVDYIYIPLVTYKNKNVKQVSIGSIIVLLNTVIIENDYLDKEKIKKGAKKNISKYTKEDILKLMKDNGVVGMSGNIFPTHYKYGMDLKINKLIVNAVEDEIYITSDFTNLNDKPSEILEAIDALMSAFNIEECYIALKSFNKVGIDDFINYMGTYPNIHIEEVPDKYPVGYERNLANYIYNAKIKKYPMEKSIMVNNISTIYEIYRVLKYEKPVCGRIVTISGNAVKNPTNVYIKYGTLLSDVLKEIGGLKYDDINIIINGYLREG